MPNASASAPASSLPFLSQRADRRATATRSTFADALTFAFEIAYRAPESLSLAQRAAYGLDRHVARRAQLGDVPPFAMAGHVARRAQLGAVTPLAMAGRVSRDVARRAQLGELTPLAMAGRVSRDVARRAQLGETGKLHVSTSIQGDAQPPATPYFTFTARAGGAEIAFVVANGRVFAGVRSWTR